MVETRGDPEELPDELLDLLAELDPDRIVVGIPRHMDGSEGEMAREARAFGRAVEERSGVPVTGWDERLSSEAARRALIDAGASRRTRETRGTTDMMAATLLLRAYLGSLP